MLPKSIEKSLRVITEEHHPRSIFLYGSQARGDATSESDYEIGVIFNEEQYVGRTALRASVRDPLMSVYPFKYEQFVAGNPDTPFQKRIHMYELSVSALTLTGEQIVEKLKRLPIRALDVVEDFRFNLGYALAATITHRSGHKDVARILFYKSALFATRDLIMAKKGVFSSTYQQIVEVASTLDLGANMDIITHAYQVRCGKELYDENLLFKNITFINQVIEPVLRQTLESRGNEAVLVA